MSDEKKREELKAKINEQLDELSVDDLEQVSGGSGDSEKTWTCPYCKKTFTSSALNFAYWCGMHEVSCEISKAMEEME